MGDSDCWSIFLEQFATENGAYINQSDGVYMLGQMYSFDKKLEVAAVFWLALIWDYQQGKKVKHGVVAKICCMSTKFMDKIYCEIMIYGRVLLPSDMFGSISAEKDTGS